MKITRIIFFLFFLLFVSCSSKKAQEITEKDIYYAHSNKSEPVTFIYESDTLTQILDFLYIQDQFIESDTIWHNEILFARKEYIHINGVYRLVQIRSETEIDTIYGMVNCGGISDCLGPEIGGYPLLGYLCGFNDFKNKVYTSIVFLLNEDVFYSARFSILKGKQLDPKFPNLEMFRVK